MYQLFFCDSDCEHLAHLFDFHFSIYKNIFFNRAFECKQLHVYAKKKKMSTVIYECVFL